jgi:predicted nucleotidyltransferase
MGTSTFEVLREAFGRVVLPDDVVAVHLFGLAARDRQREDSDVDVAFLPDYGTDAMKHLETTTLIEGVVQKAVGDSNAKVDVVNLRSTTTSVELKYEVITQGRVLYEKDHDQRLEFEAFVRGEYFDFMPFVEQLRRKKLSDETK